MQAASIAKTLGISRERVRRILVELELPTRVRKVSDGGNSCRSKLIAFREDYGFTQPQLADLIANATRRPCSTRIIQAWEAPADCKSARTCPDWVVAILDGYIEAHIDKAHKCV